MISAKCAISSSSDFWKFEETSFSSFQLFFHVSFRVSLVFFMNETLMKRIYETLCCTIFNNIGFLFLPLSIFRNRTDLYLLI